MVINKIRKGSFNLMTIDLFKRQISKTLILNINQAEQFPTSQILAQMRCYFVQLLHY